MAALKQTPAARSSLSGVNPRPKPFRCPIVKGFPAQLPVKGFSTVSAHCRGMTVGFEPIPLCPSPHTIQSQITTFKVERFQKVVTPTLSFAVQLQVSLDLPYSRRNITEGAAPITLTKDLY